MPIVLAFIDLFMNFAWFPSLFAGFAVRVRCLAYLRVCSVLAGDQVREINKPGLARFFYPARFQNMNSGTRLTVKYATDTKTPANSTSPRPEPNGRRHGPGFDEKT